MAADATGFESGVYSLYGLKFIDPLLLIIDDFLPIAREIFKPTLSDPLKGRHDRGTKTLKMEAFLL